MEYIEKYSEDIASYHKTMEKRIKNGQIYIVIPYSYNKTHEKIEAFYNEIDSQKQIHFIYIKSHTIKMPFVMFIPNNITNNYLIMHGNNNAKEEGNPVNTIVAIEEMTGVAGFNLTKENAVVIVPVTSNYIRSEKEFFPMQASRNVIYTNDGIYKDLFKQINAIISWAKKYVKNNCNVRLKQKIIVHGFSSSAKFGLRYASIYPEKVKLLIAGGFAVQNILPIKEYKNTILNYPIGINDIELIRKEKINYEKYLKAFKKMKQYLYMGELENQANDTAFSNIHTDANIQDIYRKLFGPYMMPNQGKINRYDQMIEIIKKLKLNNIEMKIYKNIGHDPTVAIDDIRKLIRDN